MPSSHPAPDQERRAQESLHRKLLGALFGGILLLALFGVSVSALAVHDRRVHAPRPVAAPLQMSVVIRGGNKLAPDGKRHDSWSVTDYRVPAGRPVRLLIDNRDGAPHTMTSPQAGVDIVAAPGRHRSEEHTSELQS